MRALRPTAYYDRMASEYDKLSKEHHWLSPQVMFGILFEHVKKGDKLLDVGIGTGLSSRPFSDMGMCITGIDGSKKMLLVCRSKKFAETLKWANFDGKELPFPDSSFEMTISNGALYFVKNVCFLLQEIARVTKRGGHIAVNFEELADGLYEEYTNCSNSVISRKIKERTGVSVYKYGLEYIRSIVADLPINILEVLRYYAYTSPTTGEDVYFTLLVAQKR